ncbi:MerR family DNA-binding protein [Catellatospora sichuanensis]|uniref:MerR family DNA-binding protein n=1 Tax=Catellatospora sichuanensis TaxID=1969805 RepID=UPI0011826F47|nr:MerR family DNA-binding protein [Catellatospora sichuanensis]
MPAARLHSSITQPPTYRRLTRSTDRLTTCRTQRGGAPAAPSPGSARCSGGRPRRAGTAQRLGFTLDEVAELVGHPPQRRRSDTSLQKRAATKLVEIETKIADLRTIAANLRTALDAGCDDLTTCATDSWPDAIPSTPGQGIALFLEVVARQSRTSAGRR